LWQSLCDQHAALLIEQLGAEEFAVREAATRALVHLVQSDGGHVLLPRLETATHYADVETARRAERVLAEFYNLRPSTYSLLPWIDMLPATVKDRDEIIRAYRQPGQPGGATTYDAPRWLEYRFATGMYISDLLRTGQPRSQVRKLLDEMAAAERQYKLAHHLPEDY
jgi:hypothetical protein